ncbi:E2/UBC family protein [Acidovorax delafieldii]|uniref:E2/UBC family protein n=1 Tax=Acidovorax delafieldii TaxID=47920 RepID=UPI003ED0F4EB
MHTVIHVAGNRFDTSRGLVAGAAIYNLADVDSARQHLLLELADDRDIPLRVDDQIIINGRERFSISEGPCPADDNPCLRKPLSPVVNEQELSPDKLLHQAKLTFEQLAALDPDFESGDGVFVELKDVPDAQITPGMRVLVQDDDRFYTSPCGNVGFNTKLEADLDLLRARCSTVARIDDGTRSLVIVRALELPAHWNRTTTDILFHAPQGYPLAAMDMFWVTPGLALADGRSPQNADQIEMYAGEAWQRFSWHYPPGHRWNPATDGLLSHLRFARMRLGQAN